MVGFCVVVVVGLGLVLLAVVLIVLDFDLLVAPLVMEIAHTANNTTTNRSIYRAMLQVVHRKFSSIQSYTVQLDRCSFFASTVTYAHLILLPRTYRMVTSYWLFPESAIGIHFFQVKPSSFLPWYMHFLP